MPKTESIINNLKKQLDFKKALQEVTKIEIGIILKEIEYFEKQAENGSHEVDISDVVKAAETNGLPL